MRRRLGRAASPLLPLFCLLVCSISAETSNPVHLFVGQLLNISLPDASSTVVDLSDPKARLPSWLFVDNSTLLGIPAETGRYFFKVSSPSGEERTFEVKVGEEKTGPCGDSSASWLEVPCEEKGDDLRHKINEVVRLANAASVPVSSIRLLSWLYSRSSRRISSVTGDEPGKGLEPRFVAFYALHCGTDTSEFIDSNGELLIEQYEFFYVVHGEFAGRNERREPLESALSALSDLSTSLPDEWGVTLPAATLVTSSTSWSTSTMSSSSTSHRTTRAINRAPVTTHPLSSFTCGLGLSCSVAIPERLFLDREEGSTSKLALSVLPNNASEGPAWLFADKDKGRSGSRLQGIPLRLGTFSFRLEGRDKANQVATAPFQVTVKDQAPPTKHIFKIFLYSNYSQLSSSPKKIYHFVHKLVSAFNANRSYVKIEGVDEYSLGTVISWSNLSITRERGCQEEKIRSIYQTIATRKPISHSKPFRKVIANHFSKAMSYEFHPEAAYLDWVGECEKKETKREEKEDQEEGDEDDEGVAQSWGSTLLYIVGILFLLILLLLLVLCCCLRRDKKRRGGAEYMTKGTPVVFPDEVEDDVGEGGSGASASAPMLVKEERPPLRISQHDNPLYKPPPPLAASSPSPALSPLSNAAAASQRLPPPYVPP